jgi:hypothetical protein
MVNLTLRPFFPWERTAVTTELEAVFVPKSFWTFGREKNHFSTTGIRTVFRPTRDLVTMRKTLSSILRKRLYIPVFSVVQQHCSHLFPSISLISLGLTCRRFYARLSITTNQTNGLYLSEFTPSVNNEWFFHGESSTTNCTNIFPVVSLPTQYVLIFSDRVPLFTPALFRTLFDLLKFP